MQLILTLLVIGLFLSLMYYLAYMKKQRKSYNRRVLTSLVLGIIFGLLIQLTFGSESVVTSNALIFMSIFGDGYITLLKMLVVPLILVAMTTAIMNSESDGSLSKIAPKVIAVLITTVVIAAIVGVIVTLVLPIDGNDLVSHITGSDVTDRASSLVERQAGFEDATYADYILNVIPSNIVYMLAGVTSASTLSTVLFSMFLGYSILQVKKRKPDTVKPVMDFINGSKEVVLSMVKEVLKLTPFAILALMTTFFATSTMDSILGLIWFLIGSYLAIGIMYLIHLLIIKSFKLNVRTYVKKTWPVTLFGFSSRSSMATLPVNIETQTSTLGVDAETASISASFGASIGQNGCAGIYPAMLAIMAMQVSGGDITLLFIIQLIFVIAISSFGIAGVGGGATIAAVAVLTILGLDVTIAAVLVSIEPIIDMARTALNINDSMVAGVVTAKLNNTLDEELYNNQDVEVDVVE